MSRDTSLTTSSGGRGRQCSRHACHEYCLYLSARGRGSADLSYARMYIYLQVGWCELTSQAGPFHPTMHNMYGWVGCPAHARWWTLCLWGRWSHHRDCFDKLRWVRPSCNPSWGIWIVQNCLFELDRIYGTSFYHLVGDNSSHKDSEGYGIPYKRVSPFKVIYADR